MVKVQDLSEGGSVSMSLIRTFIRLNIRWSGATDRLIAKRFSIDGNADFKSRFVPTYLTPGAIIYDIGGGKTPFLSLSEKQALSAYIVGIDISESELKAAPAEIYDRTIAKDICAYRGAADGDLAICCTVLEHVNDVDAAIASIATCLKPGGTACVFVPSRNAIFARLNLLLPEAAKRAILFAIQPETRNNQGFKSYYNNCVPSKFRKLAEKHGFKIVEEKYYYRSAYFDFFFPFYLLWRLWVSLFFTVRGKEAAETFSLALVRL
ncbi:MAG: methyltransferase domain-containing protein [Rhodomicrobium sp.]